MVQAPPAAPSYSTASSCPNIQPLKPASCGGGRSDNQCWSRGVRDTDCPGHGLCCFDGCAYTCLPFNPKARQPIIHQEYGNKNKLPIKPKDPYAKKPIITTTHSNNNHYNQHDKSLESKKIHATNQHTKPYFEPKNSDSSYDDHQPDHHHQKLKPRGYPDHARPVNNQKPSKYTINSHDDDEYESKSVEIYPGDNSDAAPTKNPNPKYPKPQVYQQEPQAYHPEPQPAENEYPKLKPKGYPDHAKPVQHHSSDHNLYESGHPDLKKPKEYSAQEIKFTRDIITYWTNFVKNG